MTKINDNIKETLKSITPAEMESHGIIQRAGHDGYICPACGNGTGKDGTGIKPKQLSNGYEYYCFKCDNSFDNIGLLAEHFHLDAKNDFVEIIKRGAGLFNITDTGSNTASAPTKTAPKKPATKNEPNLKNLQLVMKMWASQIENLPEGQRRDLTLETLKRFGCGYAPDWSKANSRMPKTPRLIIPSGNGYLARLTIPEEELPEYPEEIAKKIKPKDRPFNTTKGIFNINGIKNAKPDDLIFLVEGEIDAMSVWQASGIECAALGGSAVTAECQNILNKIPPRKFIVMFDNDETGKSKAPKAVLMLTACGHYALPLFLPKYNDANEFLHNAPEEFSKAVKNLYQKAKEIFDNATDDDGNINPGELDVNVLGSDGHTTQAEIPSCPVNVKIPVNYNFSPFGISDQKGLVSKTPVVVTKILEEVEGGSMFKSYEIAHYDKSKKRWFREIVDGSMLFGSSKIVGLANFGIVFSQSKAKAFNEYFVEAASDANVPRVRAFPQPGWIDDDCTEFAYPPEGKFNQKTDYIVDAKNIRNLRKMYGKQGDGEVTLDLLKRALKTSHHVRAVLFAAIAAPILNVTRTRNSVVHLWGENGGGKTAALNLAASIFGKPRRLRSSFNGTLNGLERAALLANDFPFFINEFQEASPQLKEQIISLIYNTEDGQTKVRANADISLRDREYYRTIAFTTGEEPLLKSNATRGAFARVISINTSHVFDNDFAVEIHQKTEKHFGIIGREWIEYIKDKKDEINADYLLTLPETQKIPEIIAHRPLESHIQAIVNFYVGGAHFCRHFGLMTYSEIDEMLGSDISKLLLEMPSEEALSDTNRALKFLRDWVFFNPKNFDIEYENQSTKERTVVANTSFIRDGVKTSRFIAFIPERLCHILEKEGGFSSTKIISEFKRKGIFMPSSTGYTEKVNMGGGDRPRCYRIALETFEKIEEDK